MGIVGARSIVVNQPDVLPNNLDDMKPDRMKSENAVRMVT
jgi:hypothetical protein